MICPCKGCERQGCGDFHAECEAYRAWKEERQKTKEWLAGMKPVTSERGVKARNERLKRGKSRKWNLKNQYLKD